ncbi:MAG: recombinase family protein [Bacteroidales bacterium]|nr:recombinase family protein [Bacteroidales bacterium]
MSRQFISWRRVSTAKQGRSKLGLSAQQTIIEHFVQIEGGELIADYCEVYTGTELSGCTQLRKAIEHCKSSGATLIIAKTDRFRNTVEALQIFDEVGGNIYFCDLPSTEKFMLTLFFALAEREAMLVSIRTKAALEAIKKNIAKNGGHMSKSGRWVKGLGREKGADTSPASDAAAMSHSKRANDWRNSSSLYTWVTQQLCKRRARKDILAEAEELYERLPNVYCTREGRPLSKGVLSRWAKELKLC